MPTFLLTSGFGHFPHFPPSPCLSFIRFRGVSSEEEGLSSLLSSPLQSCTSRCEISSQSTNKQPLTVRLAAAAAAAGVTALTDTVCVCVCVCVFFFSLPELDGSELYVPEASPEWTLCSPPRFEARWVSESVDPADLSAHGSPAMRGGRWSVHPRCSDV